MQRCCDTDIFLIYQLHIYYFDDWATWIRYTRTFRRFPIFEKHANQNPLKYSLPPSGITRARSGENKKRKEKFLTSAFFLFSFLHFALISLLKLLRRFGKYWQYGSKLKDSFVIFFCLRFRILLLLLCLFSVASVAVAAITSVENLQQRCCKSCYSPRSFALSFSHCTPMKQCREFAESKSISGWNKICFFFLSSFPGENEFCKFNVDY